MSNRGQALLESLICLPVLFFIIGGTGYAFYRFFIYTQTDYHLHEAVICLEHSSRIKCEQELSRCLKDLLLFAEPFQISYLPGKKSLTVTIELKPLLKIGKQSYERL